MPATVTRREVSTGKARHHIITIEERDVTAGDEVRIDNIPRVCQVMQVRALSSVAVLPALGLVSGWVAGGGDEVGAVSAAATTVNESAQWRHVSEQPATLWYRSNTTAPYVRTVLLVVEGVDPFDVAADGGSLPSGAPGAILYGDSAGAFVAAQLLFSGDGYVLLNDDGLPVVASV